MFIKHLGTRMHSSRMCTAHSSSHLLGGPASVHAWIPPPGVGLETSPGCGPGDHPGCGPGDTSGCGPGDPPGCGPGDPSGCSPGDLQGMLGYHPPPPTGDLQGMLGYHLQCILGYPPWTDRHL